MTKLGRVNVPGILCVLALSFAPAAQAKTVHCAAGDVQCLVAAIEDANENGHHKNSIRLAAGTYTLRDINNTIDGPNGLPSVTGTVTIEAAGKGTVTITRDSAAPPFTLMHVASSGNLTLESMALTNGVGALVNSGGVVVITDSVFTGNTDFTLANREGAVTVTNSAFTSNDGFALSNSGDLTIRQTTFSRNSSNFAASALVTSSGHVTIDESRFVGNSAAHRVGALMIRGGTVSITATTFEMNGSGDGGAMLVDGGAIVHVADSAFVSNYNGDGVAALYNILGEVDVTNSTFANNGSAGPNPRPPVVVNLSTLRLTNSTLANNRGCCPSTVLLIGAPSGTTTVENTILGHDAGDPFVQDCAGSITSLGYNLIVDPTGCIITLQPGDLTGDAGLGAYADDGRPGNGHFPLLPTSLAIDAAKDEVCPKKDQIGQRRRPHRCDIGAIEFPDKKSHGLHGRP